MAPVADAQVRFVPLALPSGSSGDARLTAEAAWEIRSTDPFFGGFSALLARPDGRLTAFSDRGGSITFHPPGSGNSIPEYQDYLLPGVLDKNGKNAFPDIESVAADPATGRIWLGYENANAIRQIGDGDASFPLVRPPAMRGWPLNAGVEAMAWLPGKGLLVMRENGGKGLFFPFDPTSQDGQPQRITYPVPPGYAVTDMAALPDGRLLVLTRSLALAYPPFSIRLFLADAPDFESQEGWQWEEIAGSDHHPAADLENIIPRDNYEGIAVSPRGDGALTVWLVSDDNMAAIQRSLLVRLRWDPDATASGQ
nr:esterase-like activity of phytase family protein [Alteraurantiacibacter aestuarii]